MMKLMSGTRHGIPDLTPEEQEEEVILESTNSEPNAVSKLIKVLDSANGEINEWNKI